MEKNDSSGTGPQDTAFSAPVELFVFNVNKNVDEETMKGYMKDNQGLELLECEKVSHNDARNKSFRVKVNPQDFEKAMKEDTWPYLVRVRQYHQKKNREQFGMTNRMDNRYPMPNRMENRYPMPNRMENGYPIPYMTENGYPMTNRMENGYSMSNRMENGYRMSNRMENSYSNQRY